jgi:hypothetical protein
MPALPLFDPAVAQSRLAGARAPARSSAYRREYETDDTRPTVLQTMRPPSDASAFMPSFAPQQPGLFQGLLDDVLTRLE